MPGKAVTPAKKKNDISQLIIGNKTLVDVPQEKSGDFS